MAFSTSFSLLFWALLITAVLALYIISSKTENEASKIQETRSWKENVHIHKNKFTPSSRQTLKKGKLLLNSCHFYHLTQKKGATRYILGRSTYRHKIYCVCLGICKQTISLKLNSEQFMTSRVKVLSKRLYWPNLRIAAVLENVQSRFSFSYIFSNFFPPTCRQRYEKLKTRHKAF